MSRLAKRNSAIIPASEVIERPRQRILNLASGNTVAEDVWLTGVGVDVVSDFTQGSFGAGFASADAVLA